MAANDASSVDGDASSGAEDAPVFAHLPVPVGLPEDVPRPRPFADCLADVSALLGTVSNVQPYGVNNSTCSYCRSTDKTRFAYGGHAHQLTVDDYEELLDAGWLRSGSYLYLPDNKRSCCPNIPVRLDPDKFEFSKQHARSIRRFGQYLSGDRRIVSAEEEATAPPQPPASRARKPRRPPGRRFNPVHDVIAQCLGAALRACVADGEVTLPPDMVVSPELVTVAAAPKALKCDGACNVALKCVRDPAGRRPFADALAARVTAMYTTPEHGSTVAAFVTGAGFVNVTLLRASDACNALVVTEQLGVRPRSPPCEGAVQDAAGGDGSGDGSGDCSGDAPDRQTAEPPAVGSQAAAAAVAAAPSGGSSAGGVDADEEASAGAGAGAGAGATAGDGDGTVAAGTVAGSGESGAEAGDGAEAGGTGDGTPAGGDATSAPAEPLVCPYTMSRGLRFGAGPHRLTVELVEPRFEPESFELYYRFNTEIHLSEPKFNSMPHFKRHLGGQPLIREPARLVASQYGPRPELEAEVRRAQQQLVEAATHPLAENVDYGKLAEFNTALEWLAVARNSADQYRVAANQPLADYDDLGCPELPPSAAEVALTEAFERAGMPLQEEEHADLSLGLGTFHHVYRLDGRIMAVSVLDVLPTRLASLYTYYNPDFRSMQWGRMTALRELLWLLKAKRLAPALKWYDMNFYVHNCQAMEYKKHYVPSELRCPITRQWVPLDAATRRRLDTNVHAPLADVPDDEVEAAQLLDEERADLVFPNVMLEVSQASSYLLTGVLNDSSKALLYPRLREYVRTIGASFLTRSLCDPRVILNAAVTERNAAEAAAKAEAEAAAAAATGEAAEAAADADVSDAADGGGCSPPPPTVPTPATCEDGSPPQ